MKNTITKTCVNCSKDYQISVQQTRSFREKSRFCSRKCGAMNRYKDVMDRVKICRSCKKEFYYNVKSRIGKVWEQRIYCSVPCAFKDEEYVERISKPKRGRIPWNYAGGTDKIAEKFRHSWQYTHWRNFILKRDECTCQICGKQSDKFMHVNHIKKFSEYPELRLDKNNGIVLCADCHKDLINNKEKDWESYFNFNLMARGVVYGSE